jgi:hypothetical protein
MSTFSWSWACSSPLSSSRSRSEPWRTSSCAPAALGLQPLQLQSVQLQAPRRQLVALGVQRLLGRQEGLLGQQSIVEQRPLGLDPLAQQGDVLLQRLGGARQVGPLLRQVARPQPPGLLRRAPQGVEFAA